MQGLLLLGEGWVSTGVAAAGGVICQEGKIEEEALGRSASESTT